MSEATLLDSITFDEWIKSHDGIVLFHKKLCRTARSCVPCSTRLRPNAPISSSQSSIPKNSRISWRCSVERVPTLIVCRNGAVAARKSGIMNPRELLAFYESAS